MIGKTLSVKCGLVSTTGSIMVIRHFNICPVHRGMRPRMPWLTQQKVLMRPEQGAIEACAPGDDERVHLLLLRIVLTTSTVSGMELACRNNVGDATPMQHQNAAWNGTDMHALGDTGSTKLLYWEIHSNFHFSNRRNENC